MSPKERDLHALAAALGEAIAVARALGRFGEPLGVRAIEVAQGEMAYLIAFAGPRFLVIDQGLSPVTNPGTVRTLASAALLVERAEDEVDIGFLHALAKSCGTLIAGGQLEPPIDGAIQAVAEAALRLAAWRAAPGRVVASLPEIDQAVGLHERLRGSYASFVRLSAPLVEHQGDLPPRLVNGLGDVERCAAAAAAAVPLTGRLAEWLDDCSEGADQMLDAYVLPVRSQ